MLLNASRPGKRFKVGPDPAVLFSPSKAWLSAADVIWHATSRMKADRMSPLHLARAAGLIPLAHKRLNRLGGGARKRYGAPVEEQRSSGSLNSAAVTDISLSLVRRLASTHAHRLCEALGQVFLRR